VAAPVDIAMNNMGVDGKAVFVVNFIESLLLVVMQSFKCFRSRIPRSNFAVNKFRKGKISRIWHWQRYSGHLPRKQEKKP
jgi:hypothetical protein